jgi:hypothetical protein
MLAYLDASNTPHEVFVKPGNYVNALGLLDAKDWEALSKLPRWSDQPAIGGRQADSMTYIDGRGVERMMSLPEGMAERVAELLMKEDWKGLETEFETYCESGPSHYAYFVSVLYMYVGWALLVRLY